VDQFAVEALFADAGFVAANQKQRAPLRIESKSDAPYSVCGVKPQLLHVRVPRAVERIDPGTAELRTELLKQLGVRQKFVLHLFRQVVEFGVELLMKPDFSSHQHIIPQKPYVVKGIFRLPGGTTHVLRRI